MVDLLQRLKDKFEAEKRRLEARRGKKWVYEEEQRKQKARETTLGFIESRKEEAEARAGEKQPTGIIGSAEYKATQAQIELDKKRKEQEAAAAVAPPPEETPVVPPEEEGRTEWSGGIVVPPPEEGEAGVTTEQDIIDIEAMQAGGLSAKQRAEQAIAQQERQQAIQQIMQSGMLTPQQLQEVGGADIDWKQALGAGAIGVIPGLLGGGAAGAAAGLLGGPAAPLTSTLGAIIGGAVGAITGFINSVKSNISGQQRGEYSADKTTLTKGMTALNGLITDTNMYPQNAIENTQLFALTLGNIQRAHAKTWKDSQEDLNRFLGHDGTPELARFNQFETSLKPMYIQRFMSAVNNPDPNKVSFSIGELEMIQSLGE